MKTKTAELIEQIRAHALANYEAGGWDVLVECWSDEDIAEQIGKARTLRGALAKLADVIAIYSDRQADAASYRETYTVDDMRRDFEDVEREAAEREAAGQRAWLDLMFPDETFTEPNIDNFYPYL